MRTSEAHFFWTLHQPAVALSIYQVTDESILSAWVGFRPLLAKQDAKNTASLPRGHVVTHSPSQLVNILGGKWTTCRALAEDAVDYTIRLRQVREAH